MMGDHEAAIELRMDLTWKPHLGNERIVDAGGSRHLPAKHFDRLHAQHSSYITERVASDIPKRAASHSRVSPVIFLARELIGEGAAYQFYLSQKTLLHHLLHLQGLGMMAVHKGLGNDFPCIPRRLFHSIDFFDG